MVRIITVLAVFIAVVSCKKLEENKPDVIEQVNQAEGAFVINEGTFGWNNASLSYVNFKSAAISNQIYTGKNNKQLGDIFQSMIIHDDLGFLAIDQSDVIVVVDINSLQETARITRLKGPRYMQIDVENNMLWVTQYNAINLVGIDLSTYEIIHEIDLPDYDISGVPVQSGSDDLILYQNKLFVSNFRRPYVYQINTVTALIEDSVYVNYGVSNLLIDTQDRLWVAASIDFNKNTPGRLTCIDAATSTVIDYVENFDNGFGSLGCNVVEGSVYVLHVGVVKARLSEGEIALESFLSSSNSSSFYGLSVNPSNGDVWLVDPLDFQQQGEVYQYDTTGTLLNTYLAGYAPNGFVFY